MFDLNTNQMKSHSPWNAELLTGRLHGFPLTFTHRLGGKWSSWGQLVSDRQNRNWTWTEKSHLVPEMSLWAEGAKWIAIHLWKACKCLNYWWHGSVASVHLTLSCWSAGLAVALKRRQNTSLEIAGCCLTLQREEQRDRFNNHIQLHACIKGFNIHKTLGN